MEQRFLKEQAIRLRRRLGLEEWILWERLRHRQILGVKFRCQSVVKGYIVDFECRSHRLIVEVDGGSHNSRKDLDLARDERLRSSGYTVLRFTTDQVRYHRDWVVGQIERQLKMLDAG